MPTDPPFSIEPFINVKEAAQKLGVPYFKLRRFINAGRVPIYCVGNSRKLLRLSELVLAIEASRSGSGTESRP